MKLRSLGRAHPPCSATTSFLAAVCSAFCLAAPVPAVAQAPPIAPARVQRGAEANLLVLEVRLEGHVLSDSFVAYQDGSAVLLPLGELSRLLTLGITVDAQKGTASGFVIREDRTFAIHVGDSLVSVNGREKSFEPRLATVIGDEIYVSSRLLAHWLPIDLPFDLGRLQLEVKPRERLPLQERLAREDAGSRLRAAADDRADLGYPRSVTPYAMASVPSSIRPSVPRCSRAAPNARATSPTPAISPATCSAWKAPSISRRAAPRARPARSRRRTRPPAAT